MEQVVALVLLTYAIGLLTGAALRDYLYGEPILPKQTMPQRGGIADQLRPIMAAILDSFRQLVLGPF